jgi:hypothetical protein
MRVRRALHWGRSSCCCSSSSSSCCPPCAAAPRCHSPVCMAPFSRNAMVITQNQRGGAVPSSSGQQAHGCLVIELKGNGEWGAGCTSPNPPIEINKAPRTRHCCLARAQHKPTVRPHPAHNAPRSTARHDTPRGTHWAGLRPGLSLNQLQMRSHTCRPLSLAVAGVQTQGRPLTRCLLSLYSSLQSLPGGKGPPRASAQEGCGYCQ